MVAMITILILCFLTGVHGAIYLPGVGPRVYATDDVVPLLVNKITSTKTQIPYDYYTLPYCRPKKLKLRTENVGESLEGDRIEASVYDMSMRNAKSCALACTKKLSAKDRKKFRTAIQDEYYVHWIVDNLPVGHRIVDKSGESTNGYQFIRGFPVGFSEGFTHKTNGDSSHKFYLNNHMRIIVSYYEDDNDEFLSLEGGPNEKHEGSKIVGFRVEPMSIKHEWNGDDNSPQFTTCNSVSPPRNDPSRYLALDDLGSQETIAFTYDVIWEKSSTTWTQRWDVYMDADSPTNHDHVHWFAISNSILIVLLMTIMIAIILVRALHKDINNYNEKLSQEEAKEESGWKLVHGDVFRPPIDNPMIFSVLVGTGSQLFGMACATLSFALVGLLSPSNRGALITAFIILFVLMGALAGYFSSIIYKMFRGIEWKLNTFLTATLYPGISALLFSCVNLVLWYEGSSGALALGTFFTLIFLWFCVSLPLVFLGSYFGYKRETIKHPVMTKAVPRQIPTMAWYMNPILTTAFAGILPFGAVTVELYFIMSALWLHHIYYIFGFLCLVLVVLLLTTAEVSILLNYFQLCCEDYNWWWRSYLSGGSCAIYMMIYALWYHLTELELHGLAPLIVYYGYNLLLSMTTFLVTGTIGFASCFFFNRYIYASLKVD